MDPNVSEDLISPPTLLKEEHHGHSENIKKFKELLPLLSEVYKPPEEKKGFRAKIKSFKKEYPMLFRIGVVVVALLLLTLFPLLAPAELLALVLV